MPRRKGALFLPLDVGFPDDDRIVEVGEKSAWLYVCMMLAAKRLGTDGVLSSRQVQRLNVPGWRDRLAQLIGADLVAQLEADVYSITAWFDHNDPIAVVQERRAKDAERKKARTPFGVGSESVRTPSVEKRREEKRREEHPKTLVLDGLEAAPQTRPSVVIDASGFQQWYDAYPLRKGRAAAEKAYVKALRTTGHLTLLAAAVRFAQDPTRDPSFTPHPATWLNQGRWEDEGPARPQSNVRPMTARVAEGDAILREAYDRGRAQQRPELGA